MSEAPIPRKAVSASPLSGLSLRDLYARHDEAWAAYCDLPTYDVRAAVNANWQDDSEASRLHSLMRDLREAIDGQERDFEADLKDALGDAMKADMALAIEVYAALCNVDWEHEDGSRAGYSWRAAGGLVNEIVSPDDDDPMGYCNFYCSGGEGNVSDRVSQALEPLGWRWLHVE